MKSRSLWFGILTLACTVAAADEGMYPISEIAALDLPAKGLEISVSELYSPDKTSLIDGICRVSGCTGSFVSPTGLIITNHHCAYRAIQTASTPQSDYLKDGFKAEKLQDEIPAPGYTVRVTESYRDISEEVLSVAKEGMPFLERTKAIDKQRKLLEKRAEEQNPGMRAEVAEMFTGKTYVLFLYTYLKDVRLVFAPPASVGVFGGDIDNWEWPRHTGDFSFMRAYVAPDGSAADYSEDNVPYRPKRHIQIAPQGVNEEDFVFLLGYPGRTSRHKTARFLEYEQFVRLPYVAELYAWQMGVMEAASENRQVALQLTSRIKSLANVEKRSRGQLKGLRRTDIVQRRMDQEAQLQSFINADPDRQQKYGKLLEEIDAVYEEMGDEAAYELNVQNLSSACRMLNFATLVYDGAVERQKPDVERETAYMDRNFDQTVKRMSLNQKDLHVPTDMELLKGLLRRVAQAKQGYESPSSEYQRDVNIRPLNSILEDPDKIDEFVRELYQNSQLQRPSFLADALKLSPEQLRQSDDAFIKLAVALYPYTLKLRETNKERAGKLNQLYGSLIEVKQQFLKTAFVPDANATLRLTYGHIRGYSPEDAVYKFPITTLKGVVDKTTGIEPFETPKRILEMYRRKEYGRFAHPKLKDVPVAILYDTDTTGGNSGSPIINAKGQLVGVNFDRAYEATINDFAWNQSYSRSIGVDIRYVLWITGEVYGAKGLLNEMGVTANE